MLRSQAASGVNIMRSLDDIVRDPTQVGSLPIDRAQALLGQCAIVQSALLVALLSSGVPIGSDDHDAAAHDDRLLGVDEAAARLGVSKDWIYRKAPKLPFTVRLGPRRLRFSSKGIQKFIEQRQGRL